MGTIKIINEKRRKAIIDAKERYDNFCADYFNPTAKFQIAEYFRLGIEAKVFIGMRTGKILGDKDQPMLAFYDKDYQYTLRRRPRTKQQRRRPIT